MGVEEGDREGEGEGRHKDRFRASQLQALALDRNSFGEVVWEEASPD